jgi:hypothetical protein
VVSAYNVVRSISLRAERPPFDSGLGDCLNQTSFFFFGSSRFRGHVFYPLLYPFCRLNGAAFHLLAAKTTFFGRLLWRVSSSPHFFGADYRLISTRTSPRSNFSGINLRLYLDIISPGRTRRASAELT